MFFSGTQPQEAEGYFLINLFSPVQTFLSLISINMGSIGVTSMPSLGLSVLVDYFPDFYNTGILLTILLLWIIIPLFLAYISFNRRDV